MILEILKAIVLGIIQGIAEFFPVSSSGHLVLIPFLFKWDYIPVYFSVVLHFATLLSLVTVFYRDIGRIIKAFFTGLFSKNTRKDNPHFKLSLFIIIATIPGAVAGYFLQDQIEGFFSKPLYVGIFLLVTAAFLFIGEYFGKKFEKRTGPVNGENKDTGISHVRGLNFINAAVIGVGQAIAILPGISRSGSAISFARLFGIKREECVRFSMLLSIPITFGAFIFETYKSYNQVISPDLHILINIAAGFVFAYLAGLFAIKFLLRFSKIRNLNYFAIYCIVIAIIVFVLFFINKGGVF